MNPEIMRAAGKRNRTVGEALLAEASPEVRAHIEAENPDRVLEKTVHNTETILALEYEVLGFRQVVINETTYRKVERRCEEHGEFEQFVKHVLNGAGCRKCGNYGLDPSKPTYLYYIKIKLPKEIVKQLGLTHIYKIGITQKPNVVGTNARYRDPLGLIERVWLLGEFDNLDLAITWESSIRDALEFAAYKYTGPPLPLGGGSGGSKYTSCRKEGFTCDVLGLDR